MIPPYNVQMNAQMPELSISDVKKVAALASLPVSDALAEKFRPQLLSVLGFVGEIGTLDTEGVVETSQVTGLENIYREDVVEESSMFTQKEALQNAKRTHNGYFVVKAVIE